MKPPHKKRLPYPALCITADFEMAWSGRRVPDDPSRDTLFTGTDSTVTALLDIFDSYEVPITWASVGALLLTKPFDFGRFAPFNGLDPFFSGWWYDIPPFGSERGKFFYAPRTVERILNASTEHEIGCHTFTHVYLGSGSVSRSRFQAELEACREAASAWGLTLESFVYPSQFNAYTDVLAEEGYRVYRTDALEWFRFGKPYIPSFNVRFGNRLRKFAGGAGKFLDERLALTPKCYLPRSRGALTEFINSTFLPGFYGVSKHVSVSRRVERICRGIDRAIRENSVFSFFFHPWHFNKRREELLEAFRQICEYAAKKRETDGLQIVRMCDLPQ